MQVTLYFSLLQDPPRMLAIQFLILSCTAIMTSGWGVLKYPEFIKHLEELEQYRDAIHPGDDIYPGKRVDSNDDNQISLYKIIKEFGKTLKMHNHSLMNISDLMKRSFFNSVNRNRKEKKIMGNQYLLYGF